MQSWHDHLIVFLWVSISVILLVCAFVAFSRRPNNLILCLLIQQIIGRECVLLYRSPLDILIGQTIFQIIRRYFGLNTSNLWSLQHWHSYSSTDMTLLLKSRTWLQTTQPTSGGAVTADTSCCANCVEPSRPQQWGTDLPFFWP